MSSRLKKALAGAAAAVVLGSIGAVIVQASADDERDTPATGPQAERAKAAALVITNGGTANGVERDDEHGATWEVEVATPKRGTVDVRLDKRFELVVIEGDGELGDDTERDQADDVDERDDADDKDDADDNDDADDKDEPDDLRP